MKIRREGVVTTVNTIKYTDQTTLSHCLSFIQTIPLSHLLDELTPYSICHTMSSAFLYNINVKLFRIPEEIVQLIQFLLTAMN